MPLRRAPSPLPEREFVGLIAALMAMLALSIDVMLSALSAIRDTYAVSPASRVSLGVGLFTLASGGAQLLFGPLADCFGRRPVLLAGLAAGAFADALAALSPSFAVLLAGRVAGGIAVASYRVCVRR